MLRLCKKLKTVLFSAVLAFVLLSQFSTTVAASELQSEAPSALQTFTETFEVIPDPSLRTGGSLHNRGDSDEFSGLVSSGSTSSYVNLIWTHVAGTEVQLAQVPDIGDFCYFPISFNWNLEKVPLDATFYMTYAILTTDDFNSTAGEQMFKVRSWLIDSSNNWEPLSESEPPYTTTPGLYSYDLNYFDLTNGWEGMVEDENGVQEDPEDVLQVAVGLTSTENFDSYNSAIPWQEYNGTVIASVTSLSLVVTVESDGIGLIGSLILVAVPVGIIAAVVIIYLMRRRHEHASVIVLMFTTLFAFTPFTIEIRDGYTHIHSLFYRIQLTVTGIIVETPLLAGSNSIISLFLWNNLLQMCFVISLLLHYRGISSRRNILIAGGAGLFIGILTFIMNGIGTLMGSSLIIIIPFPIPTLVGFAILLFRPRPEMELWLEESDNT